MSKYRIKNPVPWWQRLYQRLRPRRYAGRFVRIEIDPDEMPAKVPDAVRKALEGAETFKVEVRITQDVE